MFSIRLCDVSPVIWMLLVPLARSELGSRISLSVSGWRDVGTERFSTVTMLGAGGGLGTISAIWGVQVGGPVVQPTQLQDTESHELQRKQ